MIHIIEKWKAFCEWQQRPYQVAAKSPESHFPPFKMLFLLTALQFVVSSGFNLKDMDFWGATTEQTIYIPGV